MFSVKTETKKNIKAWIVTTIISAVLLVDLVSKIGFYSWLSISIILGYLISLCNDIRNILLKREK